LDRSLEETVADNGCKSVLECPNSEDQVGLQQKDLPVQKDSDPMEKTQNLGAGVYDVAAFADVFDFGEENLSLDDTSSSVALRGYNDERACNGTNRDKEISLGMTPNKDQTGADKSFSSLHHEQQLSQEPDPGKLRGENK